MTLRVQYIGKLPYARRLSPSTTISDQSPLKHSAHPDAVNNSYSAPHSRYEIETAHQEIAQLTREASQNFLNMHHHLGHDAAANFTLPVSSSAAGWISHPCFPNISPLGESTGKDVSNPNLEHNHPAFPRGRCIGHTTI